MRAAPFDLAPWRYAREADAAERAAQAALQEALAADGRLSFGERCFVSPLAGIDVERLAFGANCLVAAWAVLAGDITAGSFCTFNSHAVLRGRVRLGDAVRIASHASIIGFEHVTDDLERPMFRQGIRRRGVEIGDDVWIGAGAIIVDGVRVGSHAIIGAGAVVRGWQSRAGDSLPLSSGRDRQAARSRLRQPESRSAGRPRGPPLPGGG